MGASWLKENLEKAKELRKNMTPQERKLWNILRNHQFYGYEIRRQYPIDKYIVDFICRNKKIIIEIDGGQHNEKEALEYDKKSKKTNSTVKKQESLPSWIDKKIEEDLLSDEELLEFEKELGV